MVVADMYILQAARACEGSELPLLQDWSEFTLLDHMVTDFSKDEGGVCWPLSHDDDHDEARLGPSTPVGY